MTGYTKHNKTHHRGALNSWRGMWERCVRPTHICFSSYGGRGITVCERWKSFDNFLEDMGDRPDGCQLDRRNNNKGYSKNNCRWTTPKTNNRNTSVVRPITKDGVTMCLAEWSEVTGIKMKTIWMRLNRGWSVRRALTEVPS